MSPRPITSGSAVETTSPQATVAHALWSGAAVAVIVVLIATVAVEAAPHTRGVGFFSPLRYAVVTPACIMVAIGSALAYRAFTRRILRPRRALAGVVLALGVLLFVGMAVGGSRGLATAGLSAIICVGAATLWFIPRLVDKPRRWRIGAVATVVCAALELVALFGALASERAPLPGHAGLPFEIPRAMFDVDHKFMELTNGARVHYVDEGTGPTLLFLHGNPSWSFQWRDLIRGLRASYRCVALDYSGFGLSTATAGFGFTPREQSYIVEELVDRLGLRDVTLVMQDWGGPVGIGFAERRPELVQSLVIGNTWAWHTAKDAPRGGWSIVAGGPVGEFLQMNFNAIVSFGLKSSVVRKLPAGVVDVYEYPFRPVGDRATEPQNN